jgi:hypothetical protein
MMAKKKRELQKRTDRFFDEGSDRDDIGNCEERKAVFGFLDSRNWRDHRETHMGMAKYFGVFREGVPVVRFLTIMFLFSMTIFPRSILFALLWLVPYPMAIPTFPDGMIRTPPSEKK